MSQADQDAAASNPRWVPAISTATAASSGAHVGTQAAAEAARVMFRFGLWPAALDLWGIAPADPRRSNGTRRAGRTASCIMSGLPPLPLPAIAAKAHARNGVTGAMAHAFSRWAWSQATFPIGADSRGPPISMRSPCARGGGKFARLDRTSVALSADRLQPDRHRLHVAVRHAGPHRDRARHRRAAHRQGLQRASNAARRWCRRSCCGQAQGGFAMGVGYALLETLPPYRGRARQRAVEPRRLPHRARLRPAAARSRDRGAAAAIAATRRRRAWRRS